MKRRFIKHIYPEADTKDFRKVFKYPLTYFLERLTLPLTSEYKENPNKYRYPYKIAKHNVKYKVISVVPYIR